MSVDDICYMISDVSSFLSSPFFRLLDLFYGSSCEYSSSYGYSGSYVVDSFEEYSTSACDHGSDFEEHPLSCKYCVSAYGGLPNGDEQLLISTGRGIKNRQGRGGIFFVLKGSFTFSVRLTLQFCGFKIISRVALATWGCFIGYIIRVEELFKSTIERVQKTLRGSTDDIGWLQRTPGLAPVRDGTTRFMELLQDVRYGIHKLPDSFVYLLIPGLFSNHSPLYFVATKRFFSKMGLACHIAKIHSEASVEHNAWVLKHYIEELYWGARKRVMLLGHSKGGVDAAAALSKYWSDLRNKVAGLALVQSPYGGTPIASDVLRLGQLADKETRRVIQLFICKLIKGDFRALEDLTYEKRMEFILNHKLPEEIPLISFQSEANIALGVLTTLTQIAHAELPWLPLPQWCTHSTNDCVTISPSFPIMIPLSAAMAICALHLKLRYGEKSDGLVTCRDAEVPGSVVIRPSRKFDHAWMVYSTWNKNTNEADCCETCEAILTFLVELSERSKKVKIENKL